MMETPTLSLPPKPGNRRMFGNGLDIARDFLGWMTRMQEDVGEVYTVRLLTHNLILTTEPEHVRHLLVENHRNYEKSFGYDILKLFLGQGLLTSDGDFWLRQRRLAQPAFHKKRLTAITRVMTDEAQAQAEAWRRIRTEGPGTINLLDDMKAVSMRIVARALFSANVAGDIETVSRNMDLLNRFAKSRIQSLIRLPTWVPTVGHVRYQRARRELNEVLFRIIEQRRRAPGGHDDLLAMLMEAQDEETGDGMTDEQLRDECMTIFVAGHETSAVSMSWAIYLIGRHPRVEEKLRAELKRVLNGRPATMDDIPDLSYTRHVVDEALRLYPPAWLIGRRALGDDVLGNYLVPKGYNVLINTYLIHRRKDLWDTPNRFDPDRWEDGLAKKIHRYQYFPFGGGPRMCIGNNFALMEMVILLATLLQDVRLRSAEKAPVGVDPLITLPPKGHMPMKFV